MPRGRWKGLYAQYHLIRDVQKILDFGGPSTQKVPLMTASRRSAILPEFVNFRFDVHNGSEFLEMEVEKPMIKMKLGDFSMTRSWKPPSADDFTEAEMEEEMKSEYEESLKSGGGSKE